MSPVCVLRFLGSNSLPIRNFWINTLVLCGLLAQSGLAGHAEDLSNSVILSPEEAAPREKLAAQILQEEVKKRTQLQWTITNSSSSSTRIVVLRKDHLSRTLAPSLLQQWKLQTKEGSLPPEGFSLRTLKDRGASIYVVAGNDDRGVLYGVGYLLRKMKLSPGNATLTGTISLDSAPEYPVRGHQIGYRFKNNTYDAWTIPMFEQHIRELALFGTNTIQLITPISDDAPSSPLFPAPALQTLIETSQILDKYGIDCDIFYPELRKDYKDPQNVQAELEDFEKLLRQIPRVDAIYVPGGDPGHTAPKDLFLLLEREAAILRKHHPKAQLWVSGQGFDKAWYEDFYQLLQAHPRWLTGVFFGPQSRDSLETQRNRIPREFPIVFYPDIAHAMHAQFPVPHWDPIFAITEGREPINPRPEDETHIYRHFADKHIGFITYSEGVNDDVNKFIWTVLGWSKDADPQETLKDYSRFFLGSVIGTADETKFAEAISGLEHNWRGPLLSNTGIDKTLHIFQELEQEATPEQRQNWRFELALYRAYYDAYLKLRRQREATLEAKALEILGAAKNLGSLATMQKATNAIEDDRVPLQERVLHDHILEVADRLYQHCKIQLSVKKYGASKIERGANLDRLDTTLNSRLWLKQQFEKIKQLPTEEARLSAIDQIAHWEQPKPGALYDDLGNPEREPHLSAGLGFNKDPEFYQSSLDGVADRTPDDNWKLSWISYAETLYEEPIELHYDQLDPRKHYRIRINYAGEDYALPIRLVANNSIEIHPPLTRTGNPQILEFPIPVEATSSGHLSLKWTRPENLGGSGRGHQIAEVWLLPQE